ncbi:MAG: type III-A CRISPR-associated protein Csm2 [Thermodesulfovibrionales bacterium]
MPEDRYRGQRQQGPGDNRQEDPLVEEIRRKIESYKTRGLKELSANDLVEIADKMGKYLKEKDLKTTQIRRFLDGVRRIDVQTDKGKNFNSDLVILLKPKLAYAAGRDMKKIKPLMDVLEPAITAGAKTYEDFKRLLALIEGIIAYHRFHGGKDS